MRAIDARRLAATALLAALALGAPPAGAQEPIREPEQLRFPPLPEFEVPSPERVVLDNGLVVMLLEDHELPLVDAVAMVRTGDRLEPADQVGLAGLTGTVMRAGGTASMTADELNAFLENRAASIETSIGTTAGRASMSALTEDFAEVFAVFADVLREPAFAADELEVARTAMVAGISRQNDDPQGIAFREFGEIVYGETSPYARNATYASVGAIDRDDLVAWHARDFHPDRVVLGLVGDFDRDEALALVRRELGDWPRGPAAAGGLPAVDAAPRPGVFAIDKADMTQSNVLIGHLGIQKDHPDYYAVEVLNNVLSGGFGSRLFSNVRSAKGLAYAVFGSVGSQYDHPGLFQMFLTTKTETTGAGIDALLEEATNLTAKPPTEEEVAEAKQAILASFVFESDSMREILDQQVLFEYYGYPLDWLERYQRGIEAVTVEQVRRAAAEHVHPDRFSILVVGPGQGLDKPLTGYGEVTAVDITIPEPAVERAAVTAEGSAQAAALLEGAVTAMGGAAAVDAAPSLVLRGKVTQATPQGEMELAVQETYLFPDRLHQQVTLPMGTMSVVLTGDAGFAITPGGVMDLPGSQLAAMRQGMARNLLALLRARDEPGFTATALGAGEVDGVAVERLQVELDGEVTEMVLEAETGRVRQLVYRAPGPAGAPGEVVETYSDWRPAGPLTYPYAVAGTFEGEPMQTVQLESVEVGGAVDEALFARP